MAGLGFVGESSAEPSGKLGIQFVKSSEVLQSGSASTSSAESCNETALPWGTAAAVTSKVTDCSSTDQSKTESTSIDNALTAKSDTPDIKQEGMRSRPSSSDIFFQPFVRPGEECTSSNKSLKKPLRGSSSFKRKKNTTKSTTPVNTFVPTPEAKPILTKEEYLAAYKSEKDPQLQKFRKLAYEVLSLKTARPNAIDKLHSAANRVPVSIEFNTEPVFGLKNSSSFLCCVFVDGVTAASGRGMKIKDAKTNAYEAALQKILMPHIRVFPTDPVSKELEGSKDPFTSPPPEPSKVPLSKSGAKLPPSAAAPTKANNREVASQHKESNLETACLKRRLNEQKPLEDFIIVEPVVPVSDVSPTHTLRRSADFNHMLLEYEYFFKGDAARCVLKIENQVMAEVNGPSKIASKNMAAAQALKKLKSMCWTIKTKKEVDSNTKISKEDMLYEFELDEQPDAIGDDNVGNLLLRKMGWSGGGVGKYGSGIAEPVTLKQVLRREGLGLGSQKGITDEFVRRVTEVIESYASSTCQEDLVFDWDFRLDERQIIHDECRRLNLRSKSCGKGRRRYLCVRRKLTANELFYHIMSSGGETARYILVAPEPDVEDEKLPASKVEASSAEDVTATESEDKASQAQNLKDSSTVGPNSLVSSSDKPSVNGLLPTPVIPSLLESTLAKQAKAADISDEGPLFQRLQTAPGQSLRKIRAKLFRSSGMGHLNSVIRGVQNRKGDSRMEMNNLGSIHPQNFRGMKRKYGESHCFENREDEEDQWGLHGNNSRFHGLGYGHNDIHYQDMGYHDQGMGYGDQSMGYGDQDMGYGYQDMGYGYQDMGYGNQDMGYGNQDMGYGNQDMGYSNQDMGYSNQDMGYGNKDMGYGNKDMGYGNQDMGYCNQDMGYGNQDMGYGNQDMGYSNQDMGYGNQDMGYGYQDMGYGNQDMGYGNQDMGYGNQDMGLQNMGRNSEDIIMNGNMNNGRGERMQNIGMRMKGVGMNNWNQKEYGFGNQKNVNEFHGMHVAGGEDGPVQGLHMPEGGGNMQGMNISERGGNNMQGMCMPPGGGNNIQGMRMPLNGGNNVQGMRLPLNGGNMQGMHMPLNEGNMQGMRMPLNGGNNMQGMRMPLGGGNNMQGMRMPLNGGNNIQGVRMPLNGGNNIQGVRMPLNGGNNVQGMRMPLNGGNNIQGMRMPLSGGNNVQGMRMPLNGGNNIQGMRMPLSGGNNMQGMRMPLNGGNNIQGVRMPLNGGNNIQGVRMPLNGGNNVQGMRMPLNGGNNIQGVRMPLNGGNNIQGVRMPLNGGNNVQGMRMPLNGGNNMQGMRMPLNEGNNVHGICNPLGGEKMFQNMRPLESQGVENCR